MQVLARKAGFQPLVDGGSLLIGKHALYQSVMDRLTLASQRLVPGDILFLSFAGHGGRYRRGQLSILPEDVSETLCLWDSELFDLELGQQWPDFKAGTRILVIAESCNSGSIAGFPPAPGKATAFAGKKRLTPAAQSLILLNQREQYLKRLKNIMPRAVAKARTKADVLLLAACTSPGDAQDATRDAFPLSLFTEILLNLWYRGQFRGTYGTFAGEIKRRVQLIQPKQDPQIKELQQNNLFKGQTPFTV
jgi:metacaspase-1